MKPPVMPLLVDEPHGAALCGVSRRTFRAWTAAGLIPVVAPPSVLNPRRTIRRKLYDVEDLRRFVAAHKSGGGR